MLTVTAINSAKPKEKPYKLSDEKSMYLLIEPSGGKLWRFDYRFSGKRKTLALGVYPDVTLAQAREKRDNARKLLAGDPSVDPNENRKKVKAIERLNATNTFESIAREWWASHMTNKAESHKAKVIRRFELYLFPWIGKMPISEITGPQVVEVIKRIADSNKSETARRTLQTMGQVFRHAMQSGYIEYNVIPDMKSIIPPRNVKHMAAFTAPKQVAELLHAIDGFNGTLTVQCALKLSPLVFVRPGELRQAKWKDIDLDEGEWSYLVTKTNTEHLVPLSRQAIEILRTIQPLSGHGEYVFQGGHSPRRPMSESAINAALKRMGYNTQTEITGHGFRAMARTILHERLGMDPYVIEHQLAHKVPDNLGKAYNRTKFIESRISMMQAWADYLDELKASKKKLQK